MRHNYLITIGFSCGWCTALEGSFLFTLKQSSSGPLKKWRSLRSFFLVLLLCFPYFLFASVETESCASMAREVLRSTSFQGRLRLWEEVFAPKASQSQAVRDAYLALFHALQPTYEEIDRLGTHLSYVPQTAAELLRLEDFILFTRTLKKSKRPDALSFVDSIFGHEAQRYLSQAATFAAPLKLRYENARNVMMLRNTLQSKDEILLRFFRNEKNLDERFSLYVKEAEQEMKLTGKDTSLISFEHQQSIFKRALKQRNEYRNLFNGCHAKGKTPEHDDVKPLFFGFTLATRTALAGSSYLINNLDLWRNDRNEFWGRLGYEGAETVAFALLSYYVFGTKPEWGEVRKYLTLYGYDNGLSLVSAQVWNKIFNNDRTKIERIIEDMRMSESDEFNETIKKLSSHLEHNTLREKFIRAYKDLLKKLMTDDLRAGDGMPIDWQGLKPQDLDRPEVMNALTQAVVMDLYMEKKRAVSLGSESLDRYIFYTGFGVPSMVIETLIMDGFVYPTLCMSKLNRARYLMRASLIYLAYRAAVSFGMEYPGRKYFTGN